MENACCLCNYCSLSEAELEHHIGQEHSDIYQVMDTQHPLKTGGPKKVKNYSIIGNIHHPLKNYFKIVQ